MTDGTFAEGVRHALGRWHLGRPPTPGGVIYVNDSKTGIPHEGTACFSVYGNTIAETEALAQWLLDQLHACDRGAPLLQKSGAPQRFIHGEIKAAQTLGTSAIDYTQQIVTAEHSGAAVGSPSVAGALGDLKHAAIGYALMMIFSERLLSVEELQRIDDALTARLTEDAL